MPRNAKPQRSPSRKKTSKSLSPAPPGFRMVTPYLAVNGGAQALEFYKKALGARELSRETTPDGKVLHARMKIGDSIVMLSDQFGVPTVSGSTPMDTSVTLHVYSRDVGKLWQRATAAGAKVVMPIDNQFWGERYGQLVDPFGHRWSLSMRVKMSKQEREAKQKAAMAMFAQNQHPN
jgi:PhnB protein